MSLIRLNTKPTARDLRVFSTLWLVFFGVLGFVAWRRGAEQALVVLGLIGGVGGGVGLLFPAAMRHVYLASIYLTFPIGFVMSYVVLGSVYFLVLTPTGLIMRLVRHDPLRRRFDPGQKTYWKTRDPMRSPPSYFRQH